MKGHVIAQVNIDLQCAHGQEGAGETSSSFDNSVVNDNLDNLIAMPYEDDQQCFQISEDQDCHSDFSCFKMLFQEDKNNLAKQNRKYYLLYLKMR